ERNAAGVEDLRDADIHVEQAEALVRIHRGAEHAGFEHLEVLLVVGGGGGPELAGAEVHAELTDADVVDDVAGVHHEGGPADDEVAGAAGEEGGVGGLQRGGGVGGVGREGGAGFEQAQNRSVLLMVPPTEAKEAERSPLSTTSLPFSTMTLPLMAMSPLT